MRRWNVTAYQGIFHYKILLMFARILTRLRSKAPWRRPFLLNYSRRKLNLGVLTVFACLVFGYLVLVDVVQEHARSIHNVGYKIHLGLSGSMMPYVQKVEEETYCDHRRRVGGTGKTWDSQHTHLHHAIMDTDGQVCIHPQMDPCDAEIARFDYRVGKVNCSREENWVFVDNGTFRISPGARRKYGKITCEYAPIVRGKGDFTARHAEHIKPMLDGSPLISDFFKVACISPSGKRYHNIHAGVAYNEKLHSRSQERPLPKNALGYDVFMFGFDSTSRMSWIRNLPKTREFFLDELGGIELTGYNIVGDGTVQALLPILTGNTEQDLPTARRGNTGAVEVDDFPWIWRNFKQAGYVTAWAEDMSYIGTFQMRLKGFKEQPTDHSMRTYFMLAEPMYRKFLPWCAGSEARHVRFLNWFRDMYHMYGDKPKFLFGFHSEFSHTDNNDLKKVDDDLLEMLKHLHSNGYLNHTILILMGDHGARFSSLRSKPQGKLEERLPYFAFSFPPSFAKSHPKAVENFKINSHRLTTPFDIHETFHDVLDFGETNVDHTHKRGISLFTEVPKNRTCEQAAVEPHWCACLQWMPVNDSALVQNVTQAVVNFINGLMSDVRHVCALLTVKRIIDITRLAPNSQMLKFKKSSDIHGDIPDLTDTMTLNSEYFQISLVTEPGQGHFEVTVKHSLSTDAFHVSEKEISRTNRYGDAPKCIAQNFPNLRPYCYCF